MISVKLNKNEFCIFSEAVMLVVTEIMLDIRLKQNNHHMYVIGIYYIIFPEFSTTYTTKVSCLSSSPWWLIVIITSL